MGVRLEWFFWNSQLRLHQVKQGIVKKILKLSCEVSYTSILLSLNNFVSCQISCERKIIFTIKKVIFRFYSQFKKELRKKMSQKLTCTFVLLSASFLMCEIFNRRKEKWRITGKIPLKFYQRKPFKNEDQKQIESHKPAIDLLPFCL